MDNAVGCCLLIPVLGVSIWQVERHGSLLTPLLIADSVKVLLKLHSVFAWLILSLGMLMRLFARLYCQVGVAVRQDHVCFFILLEAWLFDIVPYCVVATMTRNISWTAKGRATFAS